MFSVRFHNVRLLSVLLFGALAGLAATQARSQTQEQTLDAVFQEYHRKGEFDGVALVAQRGKILYQRAFGLANREKNLPNALATPYRICSVTKQFTALLVMQLVAQGRLRLDGTVMDYLSDFRRETGSRITLKQLLNHTSGLPSLDDALPEKDGIGGFYLSTDPRFADAAYVVRTYCQGDLKTQPGEKFNYNNADYIVLGAILEKVTGKPYAVLLRERVLLPLGMRHTGVITTPAFAPGQALGYIKDKNGLQPEPTVQIANFGAAGAMYSTVADMLRWDRALDTNRLLAKEYMDIMFTPSRELGYVALGSWVYPAPLRGVTPPPQLVERQGAIGAFSILNLRAPIDEYSIIVFSNVDTTNIGMIYSGKGLTYDLVKTLYPAPLVASPVSPLARHKGGEHNRTGERQCLVRELVRTLDGYVAGR